MPGTFLRFLNLVSISFWLGSIFFFSFFAAPSIFKILPKHLAGDVVADIFPKYYLVAYVCGTIFLVTLLLMLANGYESARPENYIKLALAILLIVLSLYSGWILRDQISEVKMQIRSLPPESKEYIAAENRFKALHGRSMLINAAVFICGIVIVFLTAYTSNHKND